MRNTVLTCLLAALALLMPAPAAAQGMFVPTDTAVRRGTLPNGLAYYVRRNAQPSGRADFHLVLKAGSMQEEDSERGVALFVARMGLTSTAHFPAGALNAYCASLGVKEDDGLDYAVSYDQTLYHLVNIPVGRPATVDSCLLILRDWAGDIRFGADEVETARCLVRQAQSHCPSGLQRICMRHLATLYSGSRYAERLPAGLASVVDTCGPATLRAFCERWYRPDLLGVVVVGDVDPDAVANTIQYLFDDLDMPERPTPVLAYPVPDNVRPIYVADSDSTVREPLFRVSFKIPAYPDSLKGAVAYLGMQFLKHAAIRMLNDRLSQAQLQAGCPFVEASSSIMPYGEAKTKDALALTIKARPGAETAALRAVLGEVERIKRDGFTIKEYDRTRRELMEQLEARRNNRVRLNNGFFAQQCIDHFLRGEPLVSTADHYSLMKQFTPMMPVDAVSRLFARIVARTDTNFVVTAFYPATEGANRPSVDELRRAVANAATTLPDPYVDPRDDGPLGPSPDAPAGP